MSALACLALAGTAPTGIAADRSVISDVALNQTLELGDIIEARADGDLDSDGDTDLVYVVRADRRTLHALLRNDTEALHYTPAGMLQLPTDPTQAVRVAIARGVLVVHDRSGGNATMAATFRYRFTPEHRMRLIGLDATLDPGRAEVDGFTLSWNLLTGSIATHVQRTVREGPGRQAMFEQRFERVTAPILMEDTPDPEFLMIDVRGH